MQGNLAREVAPSRSQRPEPRPEPKVFVNNGKVSRVLLYLLVSKSILQTPPPVSCYPTHPNSARLSAGYELMGDTVP